MLESEDIILEERQLLMRKKRDFYNPEKLQTSLRNAFLLQRENVIFTPHIGFYSKEAIQRILDTTTQNIMSFIAGTPSNTIS